MIRRPPRVFWLAAALGILCFAYRYLAFRGFTNDHFVHLSRAQQLLLGEWPIRDFIDPGQPLTHVLSAIPQAIFGRTLLPEAILVFGSLALAAALTCWILVRLTGSYWLAAVLTLLQILVLPRTYSTPKLLLYPVAAIAIAWYVGAPSHRKILGLAALVVASFLVRYDHGVFIGVGCAVAVVAAQWPRGRTKAVRAAGGLAAASIVLVLPYLVYVQWAAGLPSYVREIVDFGRGDARSRPAIFPAFAFEPASALAWGVREATIHVRWPDGLDDDARDRLERELGLTPVDFLKTRTWAYRVSDVSQGAIERLVTHPQVEDTAGIDRRSYTVDRDRFDGACVLCVSPGPGLHAESNAEAWLYYLPWTLVVAGIAVAATGSSTVAPATMLGLAAMMALAIAGFARAPLAARLPDLWGIAPILIGAVFIAGWRAPRWRIVLRTALLIVLVFTVSAVSVLGHAREELNVTGLTEGGVRALERAREVRRALAQGPDARPPAIPAVGEASVEDIIVECTTPADRLLVFGFMPELFYFAGRGFAGGYMAFIDGYHDSEAEQRRGLERWRAQSVPLVVAYEREFLELSEPFALIRAEIDDRYSLVHEEPARNDRGPILLFAERSRISPDPGHSLSCVPSGHAGG